MDNIENYNELAADSYKQLTALNATLECVIDTSSSGMVSKLLSVSVTALIDSVESDGSITGRMNVKVICLDAAAEVTSYDYISDFKQKAEINAENAYLSGKIVVLDVDSALKNDKIIVQAVTEIKIFGSVKVNISAISPSECAAITRLTDAAFTRSIENIEETIKVIEEYETGVNVDRVLLFDSSAIVTNAKLSNGILTVAGEAAHTVIYSSEGIITTKQLNVPFQEEIVVKSNCGKVTVSAAVKENKIVLSDSSDGTTMRLELTLNICGSVLEEVSESVITDAVSTTNKLELAYSTADYTRLMQSLVLKDKISGSAEVGGDYDGIRKIVAANAGGNSVTNVYTLDKQITVEGVITSNIIYEAEDALSSVQIEMPYSLVFDAEKVEENDIVSADSIVEILSAKIKRDREIEVTALISIAANIYRECTLKAVSSIETGEALGGKLPAITIYQPNDRDDLWSIAKAMLAPIEELIQQNPHLKDGVTKDKVVYYRHY